MSVSGGWKGFPAKPLMPSNLRPLMLNAGFIEKSLATVSLFSDRTMRAEQRSQTSALPPERRGSWATSTVPSDDTEAA